MMHHRITVYAADADSVRAAANDAGATAHETFPFGSGVVGYVDSLSMGTRQALRNDNRVSVLPNRHSHSNDVSSHAKTLGIKSAKTARDIFAAVFAETGIEHFDPDL